MGLKRRLTFERITDHAREKLGMPPEWTSHGLKMLPEYPQKPEMVCVAGAVYALKKNGRTNYRKRLGSAMETYITLKDHLEWVKNFELTTGKCAPCNGTGKEMASVNVITGVIYRECYTCKGTGKPDLEREIEILDP